MKSHVDDFSDNQLIKKSISYIQANYQDKITLEEIASHVNLSRGEFCRFFKKITSQTPFEYLISYRINQSALLLRDTDLTITEIANMVGFGSASYYTEKFRKQVNCTPKQYRNFKIDYLDYK
ncbi:AraC-like DNA-binding protein [Bacilli bacterium PM5-3]|nr:AraC-like DNA-binding protein [Bacilli bacterium PM5-3]MDH6604023.1 AraC-like DNA-binding protein [Bacilli bacterium PM5-9]